MPLEYNGMVFYTEADLMHHGVKGMRWGVRRFEDANGGLTARGMKRYYRKNTVRGLNRLDRDIARTKYKAAVNNMKLQKATAKGNEKKIQKYSDRQKQLSKSIKLGESTTKNILKKASANGEKITSEYITRYASRGARASRRANYGFDTGLPGYRMARAINERRTRKYGAEVGGLVAGKKYKRVKK